MGSLFVINNIVVGSSQISSGSIQNYHLATGSVTVEKLGPLSDLTLAGSVDKNNDVVVIYSDSEAGNRKATVAQISGSF